MIKKRESLLLLGAVIVIIHFLIFILFWLVLLSQLRHPLLQPVAAWLEDFISPQFWYLSVFLVWALSWYVIFLFLKNFFLTRGQILKKRVFLSVGVLMPFVLLAAVFYSYYLFLAVMGLFFGWG